MTKKEKRKYNNNNNKIHEIKIIAKIKIIIFKYLYS